MKFDELVDLIKSNHKVQQKVEEPLSINYLNPTSGKSSMDIGGKFAFSQLLIDCILRLKPNEKDIVELIERCKQNYVKNTVELNNIEQFQQNYSPENILKIYTQESFFYKTLNTALRNQNIHLIFLFRKFIVNIRRLLKKYQSKDPVRVYRGQMMSSDELAALRQSIDHLIGFSEFIFLN